MKVIIKMYVNTNDDRDEVIQEIESDTPAHAMAAAMLDYEQETGHTVFQMDVVSVDGHSWE